MRIEVVYAMPARQRLVAIEVEPGTTVIQAIERSGLLQQFPQIDLNLGRFGIFGKVVGPEMALRDGDRVEIYRPLAVDPKEARRRRGGSKR